MSSAFYVVKFLLFTGALMGIVLFLNPAILHEISVPFDDSMILSNLKLSEHSQTGNISIDNSVISKAVVSNPLVEVQFTINGINLTIPLTEVDLNTIEAESKHFCLAKQNQLEISSENLLDNCIRPISRHLYSSTNSLRKNSDILVADPRVVDVSLKISSKDNV